MENVEWTELIFLHPNITSNTQPMDPGIIHAIKAKDRSLAVGKLISTLEKKEQVPVISILSAIIVLEKNAASNKSFTNCFNKAGIFE